MRATMTPRWTGLLVAATVASALSVLVAGALTYLLSRTAGFASGPSPGAEAPEAVDPDAGVVLCHECGTENELGYRFCRSCVAELPGAVAVGRSGATPFGRVSR